MAGDRKRSVWVWVATGCGALAAIGICAVGVAVFGLNAIAGSLDAEDVFVSVGEIDCGGARLELVDHEFNINNCEGVSSREVLLRWHEGSATETVYTAIYAFLADGGWGAIDGGPDGPVHVLGERPAGRAEALDVYISPDRFDPPLARRIETCVVDNADALRDLAGRTHAMSQYGAGRPELILVWRRGSRH